MDKKKLVGRLFVWFGILVIDAVLFFIYYYLHIIASANPPAIGPSVAEGLFICGMVTLLLGGLYLVAYYGMFDMLYYGTRSVFSHMNPHYDSTSHEDYLEFINSRKEYRKYNRPYFWPFLVEGLLFLLATLILYFVYF